MKGIGIMKKILSILLLIVISVAFFSGCGNNNEIEFIINESTKTLTISGNGAATSNLIAEDDERISLVETIEFSDEITSLECSLSSFNNVDKVIFGKNFSSLGYEVDEYNCYLLPLNIKEIEIDSDNENLIYDEYGILSNSDTILYCTNKQLKSYECPSYIKYINEGAFEGVALEKLTLNEGLEEIRSYAFSSEYNSIDTLIIPKSVKNIGCMAFSGPYGGESTSVRKLVLKGDINIDSGAFYMAGVEEIDFGTGEVNVGSEAFFCCHLEELNLTGNIKRIDTIAFSNNPLNIVNVSAESSNIDTTAFRSSSENLIFIVDEDNINYCSDAEGSLYSKDMSIIYYKKDCNIKDNQIVFGEGFEVLAPYCVAVEGLDDNTEFIIADGITEIQDYALDYVFVDNIIVPASVAKLGQISVGEMDYYNYKSVTILNPECNLDNFYCGSIETLKGYKGSTAEKFAVKNNINFEEIFD